MQNFYSNEEYPIDNQTRVLTSGVNMSILEKLDPVCDFGNEAGEEESVEFLEDVYVESGVYREAKSDRSIFCVRSRKGVGKSALLKRLRLEFEKQGTLTISITPSELHVDTKESRLFNDIVLLVKEQLAKLCVSKLIEKTNFVVTGDLENALRIAENEGFRSKDFLGRIASVFGKVAKADLSSLNISAKARHLLERLNTGSLLYIFLDDLDRGWIPSGLQCDITAATISAIREITQMNDSIRFRLALREDVWQYYERTDEQIDKFRQYTSLLKWENRELQSILAKRICSIIQKYENTAPTNETECLAKLFEKSYWWRRGDLKQTQEILSKLSRGRPRDLIQLVKESAKRAQKDKSKIIKSSKHISVEYEQNYSKMKFRDLTKEFKNECSEIESLLLVFYPQEGSFLFSYRETQERIRSVNGRVAIAIFNRRATDDDCLNFLYRIGFITLRYLKVDRYLHISYDDGPELVESGIDLNIYEWEVHPAFRPYLNRVKPPLRRKKQKRRKRKKRR